MLSQKNTEINKKLLGAYDDVAGALKAEQASLTKKNQAEKIILESITDQTNFMKDEMKAMQTALSKKQALGDTLTTFEVRRLVNQRNMFEQLHFAQMRHHASCL